jgi:hypothetical protein
MSFRVSDLAGQKPYHKVVWVQTAFTVGISRDLDLLKLYISYWKLSKATNRRFMVINKIGL